MVQTDKKQNWQKHGFNWFFYKTVEPTQLKQILLHLWITIDTKSYTWDLWAFWRQTKMVAQLQDKIYLTESLLSLMVQKMEITHPDLNYCILGSFEMNLSPFHCNLGVHILKITAAKTLDSMTRILDSLTEADLPLKKVVISLTNSPSSEP